MAEKSLFELIGADKIIRGLEWGWDAVRWRKAWHDYADRVTQDYGKLFVLGKANAVPIDDIYTAVNVLEKPLALRRFAREELHKLFLERQALWREEDKRRSGIDLIKDAKNYFILGKPGAGKTTFLKNVAIKAVKGNYYGKQADDVLPIYISLKAHADSGRSLIESIEQELSICQFPEVRPFTDLLLHSGKAIVLLDALDEVKQEGNTRSKVIQNIKDLTREYRESQFLITCRVAATEYEFDNVTYIEMADFDDKQIEKFIYNWFQDDSQAGTCWRELSKNDNKGLREMARVPLLLTLLAVTYEETQTFPHRRVEIYEEALEALLKKWDARRQIKRDEPYKALSLGRKRQMFSRIAAETFNNNELLVPQTELAEKIAQYMKKVPEVEDEIDGEIVLESIAAQHGIFVERAKGIYSFAHLSFQEYYTAKYLGDNASIGSFKGLFNHIDEDQWREVFLLTASLLNEEVANQFFSQFVYHLNQPIRADKAIQKLYRWAFRKAEDICRLTSFRSETIRMWSISLLGYLIPSPLGITFELETNVHPDFGFDEYFNDVYGVSYHLDPDPERDVMRDMIVAKQLIQELGFAVTEEMLDEHMEILLSRANKGESLQAYLKDIYDAYLQESGYYLTYINDDDFRILEQIQWSVESNSKLNSYARGVELFNECLGLAITTNREECISQLYLPCKSQ